ncbi:MAG: hypothetical protein H6863_00665 [Rhodospirillales bacterium]|nr:hypothetical protein [Rhodospirillales bacterium]MCB9979635.1 hypothetical protein [Rhodospirillales bacterium]
MDVDEYSRAIEFVKNYFTTTMHDIFIDEIEKEPSFEELDYVGKKLQEATENPNALDFDVLTDLAATLLRERKMILPEWLADFSANVLTGKQKRPTKKGPDKDRNYERDYKIFRVVHKVAERFSLPIYTNNELSEKVTAADIVSDATGISIDIIKNVCKRPPVWG